MKSQMKGGVKSVLDSVKKQQTTQLGLQRSRRMVAEWTMLRRASVTLYSEKHDRDRRTG